MFLRILPLIALTCVCRADELKRSPAEWAEELSAAYAKHSGFKVSYEARGKNKSLQVTMARDQTGDAVLHVQAVKDGEPMEARSWNLDEVMYLSLGGKLVVARGMDKFVARLDEMSRELDLSDGKKAPATFGFTPQFLLTADSVNGTLALLESAKPPWKPAVSGATAADADEQEVIFHTPDSGKITVNRKTGMMTRQEVPGKDGEKRELLLSSLEMDTGREAVLEIRRDWSPEGAEEMDTSPLMRMAPLMVFQIMIGFVDLGVHSPEELEKKLSAKSGYLRTVFRDFVRPWKDNTPESRDWWKQAIPRARESLVKKLEAELAQLPAEEKARQVKAKLEAPAAKAEVRDQVAKEISQDAASICHAIFGKAPDELANTSTANGKEAKRLVGEAIARAYAEAETERRIEEIWSERSPNEWARELAATFGKHSGFKASYEARGKGKSLTATIAWDQAGDALCQVRVTQDGQTTESRSWNLDETMYLQEGDKLVADTSMGEIGLRHAEMSRQLNLSEAGRPVANLAYAPQFLLTGESFFAGLAVTKPPMPPWEDAVWESTSVDVDEQEVVFHTRGSGKITVNRKTGMMTRQEIPGKDGERRELILADLEMNPGRDAVIEIRRDWSVEGAKEIRFGHLKKTTLLLLFQSMIRKVDSGEATPAKLREVLAAKSAYLRKDFRKNIVKATKEMDAENRERWAASVAEAKQALSTKFEAELSRLPAEERARQLKEKLADPAAKTQVRDQMVEQFLNIEEVCVVLVGKKPDEMASTSTASGAEAKKIIAEAIARAYAETEVECRVEDLW